MGTPRGVLRFVEQLEHRIGDLVSGRDDVALAYSGGLSSTLLAMVARKRCDLECVVAGVESSEDVRAGKAAKAHLDYRVRFVYLDLEEVLRIREDIETSNRRLSPISVRSLIPLRAVLKETPDHAVLTGFGLQRMDANIETVLRGRGFLCPLMDLSRNRPFPRALLREAAISLGLPVEWARVAHRSPATGAGINDFLLTRGPRDR